MAILILPFLISAKKENELNFINFHSVFFPFQLYSLYSHRYSMHSHPDSLHPHPDFSHFYPIPHILRIPTQIPHIPT